MGVDWYSCNHCGGSFPDCGDFKMCECGYRWCSYECAEADGYKHKYWTDENGEDWEEQSCQYCRKEEFEDSALLEHALELLNLTRSELMEKYKFTLNSSNFGDVIVKNIPR